MLLRQLERCRGWSSGPESLQQGGPQAVHIIAKLRVKLASE